MFCVVQRQLSHELLRTWEHGRKQVFSPVLIIIQTIKSAMKRMEWVKYSLSLSLCWRWRFRWIFRTYEKLFNRMRKRIWKCFKLSQIMWKNPRTMISYRKRIFQNWLDKWKAFKKMIFDGNSISFIVHFALVLLIFIETYICLLAMFHDSLW